MTHSEYLSRTHVSTWLDSEFGENRSDPSLRVYPELRNDSIELHFPSGLCDGVGLRRGCKEQDGERGSEEQERAAGLRDSERVFASKAESDAACEGYWMNWG